MHFQSTMNNPRKMMAVGMVCLSTGIILTLMLHPATPFWLYITHGVGGLLIGISLVFSVRCIIARRNRVEASEHLLIDRRRAPQVFMSIGMLLLAIAIASLRFLHPSARLGPDLIDGIRGSLFGLAIGFTLLGVIVGSRRRRASRV